MRAIPREKREDDVAREQQRSKHAIRDASVEAAGLKRKREEQYEKAKQQRKLEGKGPGRPPAVRGPVKQHTAPPVQPQQHDSSTAARKEKRVAQCSSTRAMLVPVIQSHASLLLGVCAMGSAQCP